MNLLSSPQQMTAQLHKQFQSITAETLVQSASLQTIIANAMIVGFGLITGSLVARILGPSGRGELAAIQLWPAILASLATVGLPDAVVYWGARQPSNVGVFVNSSILIELVAGTIALTAGWFLIPVVLSSYGDGIVAASRNYLVFIFLLALISPPHQALRSLGRWTAWNSFRLLAPLLWLVVLLLALGGHTSNPVTLSEWYLGTHVVQIAVIALMAIHYIPRPWLPRFDVGQKLLCFGIPQMASALPRLLNLRLDQMLIAAWVSPQMLGFYVVAVSWGNALAPFLTAFGTVVFPRLSATTDPNAQKDLVFRNIQTVLNITVIVYPVFLLATPFVLPLIFGSEFGDSVGPALILGLAGAVVVMNSNLQDSLRGLNLTKHVLFSELLGLIITFVALTILLPSMGITGAAVASLLSYSGVLMYLVFLLRRINTANCTH